MNELNSDANHILPLVWYTGEDTGHIRRELDALEQSGIREFIFENRGGDWFCTEPWMAIFDFTLREAARRGMRVWLMDDSHVNTGSANDSMGRAENAEFRPRNLRIEAADVAGPLHAGALILPRRAECENILSVLAYQRNETTGASFGAPLEFTDHIRDGLCLLDLPEGIWRIYFVMNADPARQGLFAHYITMLSRASCRHLIDEVHEKIYARFGRWFGNTFAGFFSDEPAFGNCDGSYGYDYCEHRTGQFRRLYPWCDDLTRRLAERMNISPGQVLRQLPALWDDVEAVGPALRMAYMDVITGLWRDNFSRQIGAWCEAHNVCYIGHNLEDEGAHMRTGWGCGHYFRSLAGQHMAGIDVVLGQIIPGITSPPHALNSANKIKKTNFYQYTLGKLATSLAHITPAMRNRAVCEVFGGYGWAAGPAVQRAILNHFMADGVNYFIPHAFSMMPPKAFKDIAERAPGKDSHIPPGYSMDYLPPSFYAGGFNPQYQVFGLLMRYAERVCRMISEGVHLADAAVYYPAEIDWMNAGTAQDLDEVTAALTRAGFDFDLLPADALTAVAEVAGRKLRVGGETYGALILPAAERYPEVLLKRCAEFAAAGLPVVFTGDPPRASEQSGSAIAPLSARLRRLPLAELARRPEQICARHTTWTPANPELRHYALKRADGTECHAFLNEGRTTALFSVHTDAPAPCVIHDPWREQAFRGEHGTNELTLRLAPQQLLIVFFGMAREDLPVYSARPPDMRELVLRYDISVREAGKNTEFRLLCKDSDANNLTLKHRLTRFCGTVRYDAEFTCDDPTLDRLEIPQAGDCAELLLNGVSCGTDIGPVCCFDIGGKLKKGRNNLCILTMDHPGYADRGQGSEGVHFGAALPLLCHGFTGNLRIGRKTGSV